MDKQRFYLKGLMFFSFFSILTTQIAFTQESDSIFYFDDYISIVYENHPMTSRVDLMDRTVDANEMMARGAFDPKLEGAWDHKSYKEKNYYSLTNGLLKVPTWYGVELKAGYERNDGEFLDSSDEVPEHGLYAAGISVPLGRGLLLDERRAGLKRAKIFEQSTEQNQLLMINELLYEASTAYLDWQTAYANYKLSLEGQALAEIRFEGLKQSFINGDKPAIDTLEAYISLQARQLQVQESLVEMVQKKIELSVFLWQDDTTPLEVQDFVIPEDLSSDWAARETDSLVIFENDIVAEHPMLQLYDFDLASINIDRRLAVEDLKPDIRLEYNPLIETAGNGLFQEFDSGNFKVGASFSYPILLRKERGKLKMIDIKSQDVSLKQSIKTQEITAKLDIYRSNTGVLSDQVVLLEDNVLNYASSLEAENLKFEIGESSIFLINSREVKYLESQQKRISTIQKLLKNRLGYLDAAARMQTLIGA